MQFWSAHPVVVNKFCTTAPRKITRKILEACSAIAANAQPVFVPIRPSPGAQVSECYFNVRTQVERHGGELLFGWGIWEWANVFLEIEHHAVWSFGGELLDVTPVQLRASSVLFLPDPDSTYDFNKRDRLPSRRVALRQSKYIEEWLEETGKRLAIEQSVPHGVTLSTEQSERHLHHTRLSQRAKEKVLVELANRTKASQPCVCGSERKFHKCCLSYFR